MDTCATTTTKTKLPTLKAEAKSIGIRALKTCLLGYEVAGK